jgi:cell division protein ZapB
VRLPGDMYPGAKSLLLPVEPRPVNQRASTNRGIVKSETYKTLQSGLMDEPSYIDQVVERVERLLLRHQELQRTNQLLEDELAQVTRDRDLLKARLQAARAKVDMLLQRLPSGVDASAAGQTADHQDLA